MGKEHIHGWYFNESVMRYEFYRKGQLIKWADKLIWEQYMQVFGVDRMMFKGTISTDALITKDKQINRIYSSSMDELEQKMFSMFQIPAELLGTDE